ncbi:hypothetical protein F7731_23635 [Cytobacillus depressus]|uniref:Uncharacterized protein n=1 Tax=Cytobacillus depressus TaxID=1602942 RepID=A0A6L3V3C2_9BACI|nr:hypothetical protein [Cytobacillus depressus]KAB2328948.1 hypothetical protein F7731_23635 [Cytobacillus depressus]
MIKKTVMAVGAYDNGNVKDALKIAKNFTIGLTRDEHKQIVRGYECMVHADFYKQIGKNPEKEIAAAVTVFLNRIYLPHVQRREDAIYA